MRIDRKRRQPVNRPAQGPRPGTTTASASTSAGPRRLLATLEKDHIAGTDEALLDIYRKLRPGEPPTRESAQALLENLFFNSKRYDLAKVGRYKVDKKLGVEVPIVTGTLTEDDIVRTIEYLIRLHAGEEGYETDDIDPLRQPAAAHGGRADPEPDPRRPLAHGARRARADDHAGRRGHHRRRR